jgi:hypothetical protein
MIDALISGNTLKRLNYTPVRRATITRNFFYRYLFNTEGVKTNGTKK